MIKIKKGELVINALVHQYEWVLGNRIQFITKQLTPFNVDLVNLNKIIQTYQLFSVPIASNLRMICSSFRKRRKSVARANLCPLSPAI